MCSSVRPLTFQLGKTPIAVETLKTLKVILVFSTAMPLLFLKSKLVATCELG